MTIFGKWGSSNKSNRCSASSLAGLSWGTEVGIPTESHVGEDGGKGLVGWKINVWGNRNSDFTDVYKSERV